MKRSSHQNVKELAHVYQTRTWQVVCVFTHVDLPVCCIPGWKESERTGEGGLLPSVHLAEPDHGELDSTIIVIIKVKLERPFRVVG